MNRYKNAVTTEKATFTHLSKMLDDSFTHIKTRGRELKGERSWIKFIFNLKSNNPHIHAMEFGYKKGEMANIRLVVSRPTLGTDFYKAMAKLGAKFSYGGIVVHFDIEEANAITLLKAIDKEAELSEVIALNPKRTYCDPPQGWVNDLTGKEGVTKGEKEEA